MLLNLARKLLADLTCPGALVGNAGRMIESNQEFKDQFCTFTADGGWTPCRQIERFLGGKRRTETGKGEANAALCRHAGKIFRVDVYYLDKNTGKDPLRLIIASPLEPSGAVAQAATDSALAMTDKLSPVFAALVGRAHGFIQALQLAQRAAQTDLPVLIMGESGTGKELLARTIHLASRRRNKTFVDVNCAAIPDSLVESELFGYEKGAFTGASPGGKTGFFEHAHQGSIFMDEIGDAAFQTQAKLLRVLESGHFKRIGGNRNIRVDVRLISATNQELSHRIAEGRFRADLFYRINTIAIKLPPLRDRLEDLPLLARHFLATAARTRKAPLRFSREAMDMLMGYPWPGNVRELKGVVDYAVTMVRGSVLSPKSFPGFLCAQSPPPMLSGSSGVAAADPDTDLLQPVVEKAEKEQIRKVLTRSSNRSEAIRRLGISRRTFYAKLKQYGLE